MGGGVESLKYDSTPREGEGPRGDETLGSLTASRYLRMEDGQGREEGNENPPTTQVTREQDPDGCNGAEKRSGTAALDEAMETAAGASGAGYPPEHFNGAAGATIENSKQPRHE